MINQEPQDTVTEDAMPYVNKIQEEDGSVRYLGLTEEEVARRQEKGEVNRIESSSNRTVKEIITSNIFTFFNFINIVLFVLVLSVRSYKNMLFILVAVANTAIGVFQELRAKKTLDKLKILTISHVEAIRGGEKKKVPVNELVKDDLIVLKAGNQVPADGIVLEGNLDVNESLLTGEQDTIQKSCKSRVLSGSYVTAGRALCVLTAVGRDSYMEKLSAEAKRFKRYQSELQKYINRILQFISIIIVPVGLLLFGKQYFISGSPYDKAALDTVAAVLGMIPEGLVLLTSISLALGVVRLARRNTLVQELYCIETLARVDTLCLDKTGTITEGHLCVAGTEILDESVDFEALMGKLMAVSGDGNETFLALRQRFSPKGAEGVKFVLPFSSERKFSGAVFSGEGTYLIGAYPFIFKDKDPAVLEKITEYAKQGLRVLAVAHSPNEMTDYQVADGFKLLGFVLMTDVIRREAPEILDYFEKQGVELKVISGDDPVTVAAIAARAGLKGAENYVDAASLTTEEELREAVAKYSVFGRVTPKQKQQMVVMLKSMGRTVAMTGDGVNDVLALKEADCSIAMASGSDAAKNTASLVLLDSNFASMPHIVNEGRRVVNNIKAAASMFLIKTGFSVITALFTIFLGQAYPFQPIQLSVINGCAVGIPSTLLQLEPRYDKISKGFFRQVLRMSLPTSATISLTILAITNIGFLLGCPSDMLATVCVLTTGWNYMITLRKVYSPLTPYRKLVIYTMQTVYLICMIIGQQIMDLVGLDFTAVIVTIAAINFCPMLVELFEKLYDMVIHWWEHRKDVKPPKPIKVKVKKVKGLHV